MYKILHLFRGKVIVTNIKIITTLKNKTYRKDWPILIRSLITLLFVDIDEIFIYHIVNFEQVMMLYYLVGMI